MSDRDIKNWDERLKDQVDRRYDNYIRRRFYLATAHDLELWAISGEFIYIEEASSSSARAQVRLNLNTNDDLDLSAGVKIETIFTQLFITNEAQPDEWLDIIIGLNFKYHKPPGPDPGEAQAILPLTHANPNTNVAAASNVCNRALIKADVNNTQTAWIDFGIAAVQNACMPLDAGDWIRIAISNTDRINANFEVGGEYVFIEYEV